MGWTGNNFFKKLFFESFTESLSINKNVGFVWFERRTLLASHFLFFLKHPISYHFHRYPLWSTNFIVLVFVLNSEVTLQEHLPAQSAFYLHLLRSMEFVWDLTGHNDVPFWLGRPV